MTRPVPHGTANGYNNYGCRCVECRSAETAYRKKVRGRPCAAGCGQMVDGRYRPGAMCVACRASARTIPLEELHGTETGYKRGCRCRECRAGVAAARRRRRRANLDAARRYDREWKRKARAL